MIDVSLSGIQLIIEPKNFDDAVNHCYALGKTLARPKNHKENDLLKSMSPGYSNNIWINANDKNKEGVFVDSLGQKINWVNWEANEPNNAGNEDCVVIGKFNGGQENWIDVRCDAKYPFFCEHLIVAIPGLQLIVSPKTFDDAVQYCYTLGKTLALPKNPDENDLLTRMSPSNNNNFWINANDRISEGIFS